MAPSRRKPSSASSAADGERLLELLSVHPWADGVYARPSGRDLVVGRPEWLGPKGRREDDDRLRLKGAGDGVYMIQAKQHGRYEHTGIVGNIEDMAEQLAGPLRHLLGAWTRPPAKTGRRTSGPEY